MKELIKKYAVWIVMIIGLGSIWYNTFVLTTYDKRLDTYVLEQGEPDEKVSKVFRSVNEEEVSVVFYGKKEGIEVKNPEFNRSEQVTALYLYGNSGLLFPDTYPLKEDDNGCLLGEKAALTLFGGSNVIGKTISYESKSYRIRDIIQGAGNLLVYQVGIDKKIVYEKVTVMAEDSQTFLYRFGFTGIKNPDYLYAVIFSVSFWLLPLLLIAIIYHRVTPKLHMICLLLFLCVFILLCKQSGLSAEILPGKVSDFEAWQELWQSMKNDICFFFQKGFYGAELIHWKQIGAIWKNYIPAYICCIGYCLLSFMKRV